MFLGNVSFYQSCSLFLGLFFISILYIQCVFNAYMESILSPNKAITSNLICYLMFLSCRVNVCPLTHTDVDVGLMKSRIWISVVHSQLTLFSVWRGSTLSFLRADVFSSERERHPYWSLFFSFHVSDWTCAGTYPLSGQDADMFFAFVPVW